MVMLNVYSCLGDFNKNLRPMPWSQKNHTHQDWDLHNEARALVSKCTTHFQCSNCFWIRAACQLFVLGLLARAKLTGCARMERAVPLTDSMGSPPPDFVLFLHENKTLTVQLLEASLQLKLAEEAVRCFSWFQPSQAKDTGGDIWWVSSRAERNKGPVCSALFPPHRSKALFFFIFLSGETFI